MRGLAAALSAVAFLFLQHEINGRRRDGFLDVTAADAGAEGAVPVALDAIKREPELCAGDRVDAAGM